MYTQLSIPTDISNLCLLSGTRNKNTQVTTRTPSTQILVFNIILQCKKLGLLGEMTDSRTGQDINQLSLEHIYKVIKYTHTFTCTQIHTHNDGRMSKGHRDNRKLPMAKVGPFALIITQSIK